MTISSLPAVPTRSDPSATFIAKADAFMAALPTFVNELNAMGTLYNLATTTTSASSVLIGTGAKTFTVAAGLGFAIGMTLAIASTANSANAMLATVTGYSSTTLSVNVTSITGSGTLASWTISLAATTSGASLGSNTFSGVQNYAQGTDIASAATVNLTTATGNGLSITGTTGITAFTLGNGMSRYVTFAGALLLTYNASTMKLNTGGANYTTVAGDSALVYALAGVVYVSLIRADGLPIINGGSFASGTRMTFNQTAAPTGWTKDITAGLNDSIMRIVTGTVGSGGSNAFTTFNNQTSTSAYTLSITDIPSHTHDTVIGPYGSSFGTGFNNSSGNGGSATFTSSAKGGGGAHSHGLTHAIKYNDFIIATKD